MRRRKNLLSLSSDSLAAFMVPGKTYTVSMLSWIFDGTPADIAAILKALEAAGRVESAPPCAGRCPDHRETRRLFWMPASRRANVAERRTAAAEVRGELANYDLLSHQRLCMASRR